ncbi:MAG: ABC transporter ATP-binding protein [Acetobacteraceae bacterium]
MNPLIEVRNLVVEYPLRRGLRAWLGGGGKRRFRAVNGVSFAIGKGAALGLVGESGCGKSTLGRALLRLERAAAGSVVFEGRPIEGLSGDGLLALRRRAQMIFQDPLGALNSRLSVRSALSEVIRVHRIHPRDAEAAAIADLLRDVGLPLELIDRRPRSLSGGQCQRVVIARALAMGADFLVADEPTSALDVSVQAQIMSLFKRLREERHLTLLFISHDLRVVRYLCDTVAVMYLGRIVEYGAAEAVFSHPRHPYTQALMASAPRLGGLAAAHAAIRGEPPSPADPPRGCPFHPRCPFAMEVCRCDPFPEERVVDNVAVWCHLYDAAASEAVTGGERASRTMDGERAAPVSAQGAAEMTARNVPIGFQAALPQGDGRRGGDTP